MKRFLSLFLTTVLIACLFSGCGASAGSTAEEAGRQEAMAENMSADKLAASGAPQAAPLPENRKWVITSQIRAETENLDSLLEGVLAETRELGGYVEDQNLHNGSAYYGENQRSASLTIRVPAEKVDDFLTAIEAQANVISTNKNLEDITLQYVDTETRLEALKTEETRLLELMEQAQTVSDLLEIEKRLTDVHYELENVTSRLRTYDNQVNYATVYLSIEEVREFTPVEQPGFFQRISQGFVRSMKGVGRGLVDFLVFLIVSLPYLVVWALAGLAIFGTIRACVRRKGRKNKGQNDPKGKESPQK